ncbi:Cellulose synthase catalytic subunit [UDP-forming] [Raoultella terrigena]|uniref:Cellulose synthase catalytic subunit [UDP-forming] n=1 Tax=Raoultella terrigena TaxID=577 RepID=A0A4U9D9H5_RAOTE|nr:Cellulose synthase catalytic subunit [UDP-forming] [Raoultella terrigena]
MNDSEVGLQLLPLTNKQHIDFVQCTFARADTWALWQDSFPEDKPMESLLDILKLGFRGYRHLAEFLPAVGEGYFPLAYPAGCLDSLVYSPSSRTRRGDTNFGTRNGSTMMIMR